MSKKPTSSGPAAEPREAKRARNGRRFFRGLDQWGLDQGGRHVLKISQKKNFDSWLKQFTFNKVDTPRRTGANFSKQHERNMSVDVFYKQKMLMPHVGQGINNITNKTTDTPA